MGEAETVVPQAGAIVFKSESGTPKVLLVRAKKDASHWIFPKGHIEPGESAEAASARELLEEAGVCGTPVRRAGESNYLLKDKKYNVVYFLLRYISTQHTGEHGRSPRWCTVEEAISLLSFSDSRELLKIMAPYLQ
jgi:8-oxo-dGTP pyrophosphatase MutT (NUDIX family)